MNWLIERENGLSFFARLLLLLALLFFAGRILLFRKMKAVGKEERGWWGRVGLGWRDMCYTADNPYYVRQSEAFLWFGGYGEKCRRHIT